MSQKEEHKTPYEKVICSVCKKPSRFNPHKSYSDHYACRQKNLIKKRRIYETGSSER